MCHVQPGHHHEEGVRIEQALDEARGRVLALADQAAAQEARWVQAGAPWDRETTKRARFASLHLAHVFMAGCVPPILNAEASPKFGSSHQLGSSHLASSAGWLHILRC